MKPKLRWPLEISLESTGATQQFLLIRCPFGVSNPLALIKEVAPIIVAMDGSLEFDALLEKFSAAGLKRELLTSLVDLLDQNNFLDNERFAETFKKFKRDFCALSSRPAALVGGAYPADPEKLLRLIEANIGAAPATSSTEKMLGLISPHIDYRRGQVVYGAAYRHLNLPPDCTVILIGTSHKPGSTIFQLCNKDFEIPLGKLTVDSEFIADFVKLYGAERAFKDEFLHRAEHSLELQLPFLYARAPQAKIVPILVGGFFEFLHNNTTPNSSAEYEDFVESLRYMTAKWNAGNREVFFVLGIDLAHQGRQFGDKFDLTEDLTKETERRDHQYLRYLQDADKAGLWNHLAEDRDCRRICGFPTTYTVMDTLDRLKIGYKTMIYDYQQAVDRPAGCMVTFAAGGIYRT